MALALLQVMRGRRRLAIRLESGQRTLWAHRRCSIARMTRALVSIWKRLTPWRADPGAAWWKLCQASPRDGTANHQTLRLSSDVLKGRRPVMWHTELMEKVTWWSKATRTRLPQKKAQSAACQ